jgi:CheY-like chemotaxis protein
MMLPDIHHPVKPKILVADDEPKWRRVLSLYLSRRQCEVETASNGQEAIQRIETHRPDLIIADITMPGMDGYELCQHLRRSASTRTIPFIFLTARDQETERLKGRRIGADDYLTSPVRWSGSCRVWKRQWSASSGRGVFHLSASE